MKPCESAYPVSAVKATNSVTAVPRPTVDPARYARSRPRIVGTVTPRILMRWRSAASVVLARASSMTVGHRCGHDRQRLRRVVGRSPIAHARRDLTGRDGAGEQEPLTEVAADAA